MLKNSKNTNKTKWNFYHMHSPAESISWWNSSVLVTVFGIFDFDIFFLREYYIFCFEADDVIFK